MIKSAVAESFAVTAYGQRPRTRSALQNPFATGSINVNIGMESGTMTEYNFVLHFALPNREEDPEAYLDALYESGCDDALVGTGLPGYIALDFTRESESAYQALTSAVADVKAAIPGAKLTEVGPDLLNTSEIAEIVSQKAISITRQSVRKYAMGEVAKVKTRFPAAAVSGSSPVWHLADVLTWMLENDKLKPEQAGNLLEAATTIKKLNFAFHAAKLDLAKDSEILAVVRQLAS
jgi:hypothetical protein